MKANGSVYVLVVLAVLAGYFTYQWWFNPNRAVKRQLGELAAVLTVPANEPELARAARVAGLRHFLADTVHVRVGRSGPQFATREDVLAAVGGWSAPPGGWTVDVTDVEISMDTTTTARASFTADMTTRDPQTGQQTRDSRDAAVSLVNQGGEWVVTDLDLRDPAGAPAGGSP